jgi:hypothetical protein
MLPVAKKRYCKHAYLNTVRLEQSGHLTAAKRLGCFTKVFFETGCPDNHDKRGCDKMDHKYSENGTGDLKRIQFRIYNCAPYEPLIASSRKEQVRIDA